MCSSDLIPDADSRGLTLGPIAAGEESGVLDAVGLRVDRLQRTRIGPIKLGELRTGKWRMLTEPEVESLRRCSSGPARPRGSAEPSREGHT